MWANLPYLKCESTISLPGLMSQTLFMGPKSGHNRIAIAKASVRSAAAGRWNAGLSCFRGYSFGANTPLNDGRKGAWGRLGAEKRVAKKSFTVGMLFAILNKIEIKALA